MKKILLFIVTFSILLGSWITNAYFYNEYYWESIKAFIYSPSKWELENIADEATRYCEQVYLEATRRREYTEIEIAICSDVFEIKRQQELDYIIYMYKNRGIY